MDRDEAIRLLTGGEEGIKQWNDLRDSGTAIPSLANADLSGADLTGVNLTDADLINANLNHARLEKAILTGAQLAGADLQVALLSNATLHRANLRGANLASAILPGAHLDETTLVEADLRMAKLRNARFLRANLTGADLRRAHLSHAVLQKSVLEGARFSEADLTKAQLNHARGEGLIFEKADLSQADISDAQMANSDLRGANLRGAKFLRANLVESNLLDVQVDSATRFDDARVDGCRIYRHTLESLANYGGLASGDRMRMRIVDGLAVLRRSYSGFTQWLHLIALTVFLFPYAWFIVTHWVVARFNLDAVEVIPFWKAILRFIWNGGVHWEVGWDWNALPFSMFVVALLYNVLRLILLWKTKTLELQEQASGLPVPFTLLGWWGRLYRASIVGLYINLLAVLAHTCHFLMQEIPISQSPLPPG